MYVSISLCRTRTTHECLCIAEVIVEHTAQTTLFARIRLGTTLYSATLVGCGGLFQARGELTKRQHLESALNHCTECALSQTRVPRKVREYDRLVGR